ncbi:COG1361 S-layer family protein [Haloarchaeobius amylolyticus]|uniref:COG1361 S-layer family protein n=1 Tax=Haloarchaeobius amylolyticus TaxID=1198296 RepID=A0ABD6BBE3_9EURY
MTGAEREPTRRRRHIVTLLLAAVVVASGVGSVASLPDGSSVAPQVSAPDNATARNESATTVDGDGTADGAAVRPQPGPPAPAGNETIATSETGPSTAETAGIPVLRPVDDNVTVAVADNESVRAGEPTTMTFEVTNDGDEDVTDVVVTLQTTGTVTFGPPTAPQPSQSLSLEELDDDETETVTIDVSAARVESGTYPVFATVQYTIDEDEDDDDDTDETVVTGGPSPVPIPVDDARSFDITLVRDRIPVDGSGVYTVRVTNDGSETVTDIVAALNVTPPLSSESPTAYVGRLEAGESETVRFALESSTDAIETTTGVEVTLIYDTGTGDRTRTDPVTTPVTIADTDEPTDVDSVVPFAAVAVVFLLAAIWWLRRR